METGCRVRGSLGLFPVPTVLCSYSLFFSAWEGSSLCKAVQQVYLDSTGHGHLLQSGNAELSKLDLRKLLGAAGGASMK